MPDENCSGAMGILHFWCHWQSVFLKIAQWRGVAPLCQMKKMHGGAMYVLHCAILAPLAVAAAAAVAHLAPLCHAICFVF